jgi:hypothetical protein
MSSISVAGNTSGSVTLQAQAVAGSSVLTLPVATDTLVGKATTDVLTNKTLGAGLVAGASLLTSGTAVASTSGTSIDFTGIPSWVKRVTVMFNGVSTNGTSNIQVQIGSGSVTTTGYLGLVWLGNAYRSAFTSGFITTGLVATDSLLSSQIVLTLFGSNTWVESANITDYSTSVLGASSSSGKLVLGGTLDRLRITTVNGTDTFDAGSINIMYE